MPSSDAILLEFRLRFFFGGFVAAFVLGWILTGDPHALNEPLRIVLKKYIVPDQSSAMVVFTSTSLAALFFSGLAGITCTNPIPRIVRYTNKSTKGLLFVAGALLGHFFGYGAWHMVNTGFSLSAVGLLSYLAFFILQPVWLVSSIISVVKLLGSEDIKPWQRKRIPYFRALCIAFCLLAVTGAAYEFVLKSHV